MKNYYYNGMNAGEIANKIIQKEEAYPTVDYNSLSFEEKFEYVARNNFFFHPLHHLVNVPNEVVDQFIEEARQRAEKGDTRAMGCLVYLHPGVKCDSEEHRTMIQKAIEAGSLEARSYYASLICKENPAEARRILLETLELFSRKEKLSEWDEMELMDCHRMLERMAQTSEEQEFHKTQTDMLALKFVLDGKYVYIGHLCSKNFQADGHKSNPNEFSDESKFWKTVNFLVEVHFFDKWGAGIKACMALWLLRGIGCDPDVERGMRLYLEMFAEDTNKSTFKKEKLMEALQLPSLEPDALVTAETRCREEASNGDPKGYGKLILIEIIRDDWMAVERICEEATLQFPNKLYGILGFAHTKLSIASKK